MRPITALLLLVATANGPGLAYGRRSALYLLGHGGELDHFGSDWLPDEGDDRWLSFTETAETIARWETAHHERLDLLFLQQCGRGTAETYYQLRQSADVIAASQVIVGAPNEYYRDTLRHLSTYPDTTDGLRLAQLSVGWESDSIFYEYSIVNSASLDEAPARIDAALLGLSETGRLASPALRPDESYADLPRWIRALRRAEGLDEAPADELAQWIDAEVIHYRRLSTRSDSRLRGASGISVFVPRTTTELERHRGLALYGASRLDERHEQRLMVEPIRVTAQPPRGATVD